MTNNETIEKIIKELNEVIIPHINKNINNINNGGCGIFAYLLLQRLKNLDIPAKVMTVCEYPDKQEVENSETGEDIILHNVYNSANSYFSNVLKTNIKEFDDPDFLGWSHIVVEIDEDDTHHFLIDGEGIYKKSRIYEGMELEDDIIYLLRDDNTYLGDEISYETLDKLFNTPGLVNIWNKSYNQKQTPKLKKIISELV